MSPRAENRNHLLMVNQRLHERVTCILRANVTKSSNEFNRYRDEVRLRPLDGARPCSIEDLYRALSEAGVLLMGDFHPDYFCKKHTRELLEYLIRSGRRVIFATELVHIDEQPLLDRFLRGEIRERVLRNSLREGKGGLWGERWYMWSDLLQFAREKGVQVYGINSFPKTNGDDHACLRNRDLAAAQVIHDLKVANPDALVCALMGDLHLGPTHLPADITHLFDGNPPNLTIVLQNLGPIYAQLAEKGLEQETQVVRINGDAFGVQYCTPLFRALSELFDVMTINEKEEGVGRSNDEHTAHCTLIFFELIMHALNDFLGTRIKSPQSDVLFSGFGANGKKAFDKVLRSSSIPEGPLRDFLLTELSLNHPCVAYSKELFVFVPTSNTRDITESLGSFVHYVRLRNIESGLFLTDPREFFYDEVLQRAIGYIFSKVISHHRKCLTPEDCRRILDENPFPQSHEYTRDTVSTKYSEGYIFLKVINHHPVNCTRIPGENPFPQSHEHARANLFLKYSEEEDRVLSDDAKPTLDFFNLIPTQRFQLTRCIGYCLGEAMFNALMRDDLSIEELKAMIGYDPRKQSTTQLYAELRGRFSN